MPDVPPIQVYVTETLSAASKAELFIECNVSQKLFIAQPWEDRLIVGNINASGTLITGVKYQDLMPLVPQSYAKKFGLYTMTSIINRYAGFITMTFASPKTDVQKATPWRQTPTFGNHYWHPVLDALVFQEDHTFPRSTNGARGGQQAIITGPTYYAKEVYRPSISEGSRFVKQEFFANTPFLVPFYPVPQPASVSYDLPGLRGSFPECLHPDIRIPQTITATNSFVQGDAASVAGAVKGQFFPETNFQDREPYVVGVNQELKNGGWAMTLILVQPPLDSDEDIVK